MNFQPQTTDSYVAPDESYQVFTAFSKRGHEGNPGTVCISFRDDAGDWSDAREMVPAVNTDGSQMSNGRSLLG